jgi:hypothetical protein
MAEKWQPDDKLALLIAYANGGVERNLLAALLLKIAMSDSNMMASIKAIEVLLTMGTDDPGAALEEYDPKKALRLAAALDKFLDGDGDLYAILADVGLGIDETKKDDGSGVGAVFLPGLRENDVS